MSTTSAVRLLTLVCATLFCLFSSVSAADAQEDTKPRRPASAPSTPTRAPTPAVPAPVAPSPVAPTAPAPTASPLTSPAPARATPAPSAPSTSSTPLIPSPVAPVAPAASAGPGSKVPDRQSTDPTEPVASTPLLSIGGAPPSTQSVSDAAPGEEIDSSENEPEEEALPGDPWGDVGAGGVLSLRALFQGTYITTFARDSKSDRASIAVRENYLVQQGDGFGLNRVFLRVASDPTRYLGFKAILDFAELFENDPEDVLKQAYATFRPIPERLEIVAGLFKQPFSVLELDASTRFEFIHYGDTNQLTGDLGFSGRDLGVQVLAAPLKKPKRLRLTLGAFRAHSHDEHDSPIGSVAGRIETKPNKKLRFGADIVQHTRAVTYDRPFETSDKDELPNPPDPLYPAQKRWGKGRAISADARYKRKGLMVRGEFMYGDRVDIDERYGAKTWMAAWGIAAYRFDVGTVRLLPALRYEWLDADLQHDVGVHQQISGSFTVLFWERVRFALEVVNTRVQNGTPLLNQPKPLQAEPFLALDNTRLGCQLQLEL